MSEFNWPEIDRVSKLVNRNTQDIIRLIGQEVQRQSDRLQVLEEKAHRLLYYSLASTIFEAFILAYLVIR
jgi:hypothetical protein